VEIDKLKQQLNAKELELDKVQKFSDDAGVLQESQRHRLAVSHVTQFSEALFVCCGRK
jgi:hypothetical protein